MCMVEKARCDNNYTWITNDTDDAFITGFHWSIKVYPQPSKYGINGGRISKLCVRESLLYGLVCGETLAYYEREWDINPKNSKVQELVNQLLEKYN